ncbi:MAG: DNA-directed RNA polymerase subunit alpha [Candidatus Roizmanbacteria bacterium]|nr:MAG: DNA-directed RNA polymerase subunit alpha [Candidatus Roizmanbacteria bacterium]
MIEPTFYTQKQEESEGYTRFVFEPLNPSFGQSLGNSLRRTLLSSLPGAAVTSVKVEGASHLFTTLKGVKESVLDLVLNLKQLRFEIPSEGSFKMNLTVKGKGKIYGKDVEGEVKIVNKDLYLGEITDDKSKIDIKMIVEIGYGFVPSEEREKKENGFIAIDAAFSPVIKVNLKVEEARVGRKTNFDRLIMEIWTDNSITPEEALRQASNILAKQFNHILAEQSVPKQAIPEVTEETQIEGKGVKLDEIIIDELNLPSRVINALLRENIETVADLKEKGRDKLVGLKGVGRKSIDLIDEELKKMGIELK